MTSEFESMPHAHQNFQTAAEILDDDAGDKGKSPEWWPLVDVAHGNRRAQQLDYSVISLQRQADPQM